MTKGIAVTYRAARDYGRLVVEATATAPGAVAEAGKVAGRVAAAAKANASTATVKPKAAKLRSEVVEQIGVKSAKTFKRRAKWRGTTIPVFLVVSDSWASTWLEFGRGSSMSASRFMRSAMAAGNSSKVIARYAKRWSR